MLYTMRGCISQTYIILYISLLFDLYCTYIYTSSIFLYILYNMLYICLGALHPSCDLGRGNSYT